MLKLLTYRINDWTFLGEDLSKQGRRKLHLFKCKCGKILSKELCEVKKGRPIRCKSCATKFRDFGSKSLFKPAKMKKKYGLWTLLEEVRVRNRRFFKCKCECGNENTIDASTLRRGESTQCRLCSLRKKATTHGCATRGKIIPEYNSWSQMKTRCLNPVDKRYERYGGRGIKVFDEWIDSFEKFYEYMGKKPSPNHSIDRIDNDGNYEPGNVRWATPKEQGNNRANNKCKKMNL